jgi:diguanylate cyclase (GGDEF)-like protein
MPFKILVIDDDARMNSLIRAQFDPGEFEMSWARNGAEGLTAAASSIPDLILLDVDLPDSQGFEICRRLKLERATASVPVIFLTANTSLEATIFGIECGAGDYITKPFHPSELRARVRAALRSNARIERSEQYSIRDELTGMFNRKYFDLRLDTQMARERRSGGTFGCIFMDIDKMDLINTWFGKPAGDELLRSVGQAIQTVYRREDVVCRFEQDMFGALVGDVTSNRLSEIAARTRLAVRSVSFIQNGDRAIQATASIGFALSRNSDWTSILLEAMDALARAKADGGDRVCQGRELAPLPLAA